MANKFVKNWQFPYLAMRSPKLWFHWTCTLCNFPVIVKTAILTEGEPLFIVLLRVMQHRSYTRPLWTKTEFTLQLLVQKQQQISSKYVQYCVRLNVDRWIDLICPIRCPLHIYFTKNVHVIKTKEDPNLLACYAMLTWCNISEGLSLQQHWEPQVLRDGIIFRSWKTGFRNLWLHFTSQIIRVRQGHRPQTHGYTATLHEPNGGMN
jgi:hypothetical protein